MPYTVKGKCVYKKDSGAKVGCTKGDVNKYLVALHANTNESENKIVGGKADKLSLDDIAKKFKVKLSKLTKELNKGIEVEVEHTKDKEKAKEIATDHLSEFPDYYERLEKMEKQAKKKWESFDLKKIVRESLTNRKSKFRLNENRIEGKTIINVDIQPEYSKWITFNVNDWVQFINKSAPLNNLVFLFNGADTLGMISESDYRMWLNDLGIDEDVINNAVFYDKGYAFFRYCMDNSIDENDVAQLIRFMISNNINDSRDIDEDMWNQFMEETGNSMEDIRGLLENADDMVSIPDLMDFLQNYSNIVLTGGGINECLKEVEIALLALDKNFNVLTQYTY